MMHQPLSSSCPSTSEGYAEAPAILLPDGTVKQSTLLRSSTINRNGHLNLDTFSPVNENGSFEFDRVLKTGKLHRRVKHKHVSQPSGSLCTLHSTADLGCFLGIQSFLETSLPRPPTESSISLQR
jgi:hypothetical protein